MVSKSSLFSNLLFASAAVSSSQLGVALSDPHENRQLKPVNLVSSPTRSLPTVANFSGAVFFETAGTFNTASGTFIVPTPQGKNHSATFWVGLDGIDCQSIIWGGVDSWVNDETVMYKGWAQWFPNNPTYFAELTIRSGDVITATVIATTNTSGVVYLDNETAGQVAWRRFQVPTANALCGQNAEWVVQEANSHVLLADFGTMNFFRAAASGPSGRVYKPYQSEDPAYLYCLVQNGTVLTSVSTNQNDETLTVKYVGPRPQ